MGIDHESPCPACGQSVGDHTFRGYTECCQKSGLDYELPFEEVPGGAISFPGVEGSRLVGEAVVAAGIINTALGTLPVLRFNFVGPGVVPMSRVNVEPITLVMDEEGLEAFARLVRNSVKSAVSAARKLGQSR